MPNLNQFKNHKEYLKYYREYRKKNAKKLRDYNRAYNKKWREEHGYHNELNSQKKYPKKHRARSILNSAVASGKIIRKPCRVCGNKRSQGHHNDYNKPLKVIWLCALHHAELHKSR